MGDYQNTMCSCTKEIRLLTGFSTEAEISFEELYDSRHRRPDQVRSFEASKGCYTCELHLPEIPEEAGAASGSRGPVVRSLYQEYWSGSMALDLCAAIGACYWTVSIRR